MSRTPSLKRACFEAEGAWKGMERQSWSRLARLQTHHPLSPLFVEVPGTALQRVYGAGARAALMKT